MPCELDIFDLVFEIKSEYDEWLEILSKVVKENREIGFRGEGNSNNSLDSISYLIGGNRLSRLELGWEEIPVLFENQVDNKLLQMSAAATGAIQF